MYTFSSEAAERAWRRNEAHMHLQDGCVRTCLCDPCTIGRLNMKWNCTVPRCKCKSAPAEKPAAVVGTKAQRLRAEFKAARQALNFDEAPNDPVATIDADGEIKLSVNRLKPETAVKFAVWILEHFVEGADVD